MGGINCPPPFKEGEREVSKELLAAYTDGLARYCHALFSGSANFFAANTAIEEAVLSGTGKVSDAIEKLEASENMLGEAMTNLGSVASMWAMISDKSVSPSRISRSSWLSPRTGCRSPKWSSWP